MIYICIPAHNEEKTIGLLLWKIRNVMSSFARDYEILVLDDASTDRTSQVLHTYRSKLPLRIIRKNEVVGNSAALELLLRETVVSTKYPKRDSAVTLQADFSENPEDIISLVRAIEGGSDIVAGSMKLPDGKFSILRSIPRLLTEILLGKVYHEAPVGDPFCGFRAYRLIVLKKAFNASKKRPLVTSKGWLANLELLSVLVPHARRVSEKDIDSGGQFEPLVSCSKIGTFSGIRRVRQEVVWGN